MTAVMSNIGQNLFVNKKALQVFCEMESEKNELWTCGVMFYMMVRRTACQKEINEMTMMTC